MFAFADPAGHIGQALRDACADGYAPHYRAVARNLLAEHRISKGRFSSFTAVAGDLRSMTDINRALELYHKTQVRPSIASGERPAYARPDNENNLVDLPAGAEMGTILDLTGLGLVYAESKARLKNAGFGEFEVANSSERFQRINDFLADNLNNSDKRRPFLDAVFRAMAQYRKRVEEQVRLTWAAEWKSLEPFLVPSRPHSWIEAVGVAREHPVWLAVLRYPLRNRARSLRVFRPTQLDAGTYAYHFPSPPQADLILGGHTMHLDPESGPAPLVCEYIHEQVDFRIADWDAAGGLVEFTNRPVAGELVQQRKRHWTTLGDVYGDGVGHWMPEYL